MNTEIFAIALLAVTLVAVAQSVRIARLRVIFLSLQESNNNLKDSLFVEQQQSAHAIAQKNLVVESLAQSSRELSDVSARGLAITDDNEALKNLVGDFTSRYKHTVHSLQSVTVELEEYRTKYAGVFSAEQLLDRLRTEVDESHRKKRELETEYQAARQTFSELSRELAQINETLEFFSYGLYTPHFSFDSPESYKDALSAFYEKRKACVLDGNAVFCSTNWLVNNSKIEGAQMTRRYSKIMLRAFNGECDSALLKVRWNNVLAMEERIRKSFDAINKLGASHDIYVTDDYLRLRIEELRLTHEYQEKLQQRKDEERRARERIRDEKLAEREIERARAEAEKEELRYKNALNFARIELSRAAENEKAKLAQKISELERQLAKNVALKERAISMAQLTKAGHVYVISNIGSFGGDVFKIGMTRRMDPAERIRELGGASVPFGFDLHALIYSENAPELENRFHTNFKLRRINLVRGRKEFFRVTLSEIERFARENGCEIEFIQQAEAREYRETYALREQIERHGTELKAGKSFPDILFDNDTDFDDDEHDEGIDAIYLERR